MTDPDIASRRSRTLLVTFLGATVRKLGDWMPIAGTVDLMGQAGLDASSVRTAVSRLKKRGWLESEIVDGVRGYRLTTEALATLAEGDEVIWHARSPARLEDGWCVVSFSVPESARSRRHQLRAHLTSLGFGNIGSALWIAPARMRPAAEKAIAELDLTSMCAIFVGAYAGGQDLTSLLGQSWDLAGIDRDYRVFVDRYRPEAERLRAGGALSGEQAFVAYLGILDDWRRLPFRDPGLPREVLPESWSGPDATSLFEDLIATLEGPALAYASGYWSV